MSELTVITKQTYLLTGDKKTNGTFKVALVDVLDESSGELVCRELIDGDKHFNIIIKNNNEQYDQEWADMIEPNNDVIGVSYLKSDDICGMYFERWLEGDHTSKDALPAFFSAIEERMKKVVMFRGWTISNKGVLTTKKPEYFY